MVLKFLASSCVSSLCAFSLCSAEPLSSSEGEVCGESLRHSRVGLRYTSPKGIGYNQGYTTLEGFFAPQSFLKDCWLPFLDLRGHILDNGKFAANAGGGLRYLSSSRVWGMNTYYDYRNTVHQHYNQVSAGLETLGSIWDFRINGYLPVGSKNSPFRNSKDAYFQGHQMLVKRTREFALKGGNAEVGAHVDCFQKAPLYFAAGPYYLTGTGKTTWGGELRATVDLFSRYLKLGGNTAYDHFFKWTGQGQISLNIPLGGKSKVFSREGRSCSQRMTLDLRAVQSVDRSEIIPVGKQKVSEAAIDPRTSEPYYFIFVDNTSASLGTFESPYHSLAQAEEASSPGQMIYVFPGDGTSKGMNQGIMLQDFQMLLGSSIPYSFPTTFGTVSIPSLSSSMPVITNDAESSNVVTLGSHNTVSGFNIANTQGSGIFGEGVSGFTAFKNTIEGGSHGGGITLNDVSGLVAVSESTFYQTDQLADQNYAIGVVLNSDVRCSLSFTDNVIDNQVINDHQVVGIAAGGSAGEISELTISNNTISGNNQGGVFIALTGCSIGTLAISDTTFNGNSGFGGPLVLLEGGSIDTWNVSDSSFKGESGGNGSILLVMTAESSIGTVNVSKSTFSGNNSAGIASSGFLGFLVGGSVETVNISNSSFVNNDNEDLCGSVLLFIQDGSVNTWNVSENVFSHNAGGDVVGVAFSGALNNLDFSNNSFDNNGRYGSILLDFADTSPSEISGKIVGNQFSQNSVPSIAIETSVPGSWKISDNTFIDNSTADVNFRVDQGFSCLEFVNNKASPETDAYSFIRSGGTFNRTVGSDHTTNVGDFSIEGDVGDPGTCSE